MGQFDNQIGFSEEVTYGTRVVPTRFLEFTEETLSRDQENRESAGLRVGKRVQRTDRQSQVMKGASGTVSFELANKGFSMLIKHMLHDTPVITTPGGGTLTRDHTFQLDEENMMLTTQVGRPMADNPQTQKPFDYLGCKVQEWTISQSLDEFAMLELNFDCFDELDTQTLATASYPATQQLFHDGHCKVQVNSTDVFYTDLSLSGNSALMTDRRFLRQNTKKVEPIRGGEMIGIKGELGGEFANLTSYDRYVAGTIVPITFDWSFPTFIEAALSFRILITLSACRFDGETPNTGGPGILPQKAPFTVLDDGTNQPITVVYRTTDTVI